MNCLELYLVELLQGNIFYNNSVIEVRRQFNNSPQLPVITLDLSNGVTTNYSYHDVSSASDILYFSRDATININVWCNTETERESISNQILDCYYKEKTNHYKYCGNYYADDKCRAGGHCKVKTIINSRSVKDKCPDPDLYHYISLQKKYHIIHDTVTIEPPFDIDEDDKKPPLLHSVLKCTASYFEPVLSSGVSVEDIDMGGITFEK